MAANGRFLTAEWRSLAMLNYEVDPGILRSRVPAGTALDTFDGRAFVSVVGFRFLRTRVLGVPIPFHRDFEEVNLRFYVRRRGSHEVRRGVVFVKELVPRRTIAWVARNVYGENYVALPMRHEIRLPDPGGVGPGVASYGWRIADRWDGVRVEIDGAAVLPPIDSEEAFITEHYWGYARQADGSTLEYQVEHPRWNVWQGSAARLECDAASLYGPEFAEALARPPATAFVADGSDVTVRRGRRLG